MIKGAIIPAAEKPKPKTPKSVWVTLAVLVAAFSVFYWTNFDKGSFDGKQAIQMPLVNKVAPETVLVMLPQGIMSEKGAEAVDAYTSSLAGESQATLSFISNKPIDENAKFFNDLFIESGWTKLNELRRENKFVAVFENAGEQKIMVSVNPYLDTKTYLVDISIVPPPSV
jgi:hypothetical protein